MTGLPLRIRVFVCDGVDVVRAGLRAVLEADPEIVVIGEGSDGHDAVAHAHRCRPDVIVVGSDIGAGSGAELVARFRCAAPPPKVVLFASGICDRALVGAVHAGAVAVVPRSGPARQIVHAVHLAATGQTFVVPLGVRRLFLPADRPRADDARAPAEGLSRREREVLAMVARGMSNAQIASALAVSEATVRSHLTNMLRKKQLRDRAQAVVFAYESGLVRPAQRAS
jgi:DNA-binding NarL/FixJ family response regulator